MPRIGTGKRHSRFAQTLIGSILSAALLLSSTTSLASSPIDESASLMLLVETIETTKNAETQASLMRGMLAGLEGRRFVPPPSGWNSLAKKLSQHDDKTIRELSNQLSQIFGDRDAMERSIGVLQNESAATSDRRKALFSLLSIRSENVSTLLESLLDDPDLATDAIRGYAVLENPIAPAILLENYPQFSAENRRAVVETLAARKRYSMVLLDAIRSKQVPRNEIPVHVARTLKELLGQRFVSVFGEIKEIGAEREKAMSRYKSLLTPEALTDADAVHGRAVFRKTCAACHLLYGEGGKVGPDLTGSNRANLDYILLNSIDPSYDVPDGYKMVTVVTIDGRLINGVVDEEDRNKLVLKTAEQPRVVIPKEDIERRKVSEKSIMPDGQLDQLKPQEVIDLIKYLQTTEQVEMPK